MDVLSDILRAIHLRGSVYFSTCFCSPWGLDVQQSLRASFHIVVRGQCWLQMPHLGEPVALVSGDILMLPKGSAHQISDEVDRHCLNGQQVVEQVIEGNNPFEGDQEDFNIVCGYFEFNQDVSHPFIESLPDVIHLRREDHQHFNWLDDALRLIISETKHHHPGRDVLIDRFTEVLFVQIIRAYININDHQQRKNYLSALSDQYISHSLSIIHNQPEKNWTVDLLAKEVGMSRSPFSNRFHDLVGMPPMRYLMTWRMQLAKQQIEGGKLSLVDVAEQVGYSSDSAFKKAFKRFFGKTPASFKKRTRRG